MQALLSSCVPVPTTFTNVNFTFDKPTNRYYLTWQATVELSIDCKSIREPNLRGNDTFASGSHPISMSGSADEGMLCKIFDHSLHKDYMITNFGETDGMPLSISYNCSFLDYSASYRSSWHLIGWELSESSKFLIYEPRTPCLNVCWFSFQNDRSSVR